METSHDSAPPAPRRWLVIGSGGAGKSTLAREMGEVLRLPVVHLDREFWNPGWVETPKEQWAKRVAELSAEPEWIMDGNYGGTMDHRMDRADAVVLLDLHPLQCLSGVLRRRLASMRRPRPDLPADCPDQVDAEFIHWVMTYRLRARGQALARVKRASHVVFYHLKSRREVRKFLGGLNAG